MSVIRRTVLVCNRCGCETIMNDNKYLAAANIKLTTVSHDERYRLINIENSDIWDSFYLCDKCMDLVKSIIEGNDYILPEMMEKNERPPEDDRKLLQYVKGPDPDEMEFEEIDLDYEEPKDEPVIDDWDPNSSKKRERIIWDDYIVEKIVGLIKKGCNRTQICTKLKLTRSQFEGLLYKIRYPEKIIGDNDKYIRWNKKYGDVFLDLNRIDSDMKGEIITAIKDGKTDSKISEEFNISKSTIWRIKREFGLISRKLVKKEDRFNPKLVREMFEARKDGMAWNTIAQVLSIPQSTLSLFVNRLREAQPGDWVYDLAKEYGYIND